MNGRSCEASSASILIISLFSSSCNSRMRLFASTTSAGSIYTVFPDALSSCTIPGSLLLFIGATGRTSLPSRIAGDASESSMPSDMALVITRRNAALTVPLMEDSDLRMVASAGEALSLTLPKRSRIRSISLRLCSKVSILDAIESSSGKRLSPSSSLRVLKKRLVVSMHSNAFATASISSGAQEMPGTFSDLSTVAASPQLFPGMASSPRAIPVISCTAIKLLLTNEKSVEKAISFALILAPAVVQRFATDSLTLSKPILFSNESGYIIMQNYIKMLWQSNS